MLDRATPNTVPVFHALGLEMPQAVEGAYQTHWPTLKRRLQQTGSDGYLARRSQDNVPDALKAAYDHEKIASTLTLPLWIRSRLTGILVLVSTRPHRWTAEEINLAQMLARQASIALEKAQMAQANQQRLEDTERLNRILTTANRQLRRADILTSICDEIRKLLDVPAVAAGLQQTEGLDITTCCTDTVKAETSRQLIPDLATAPQLEEALEKQLTLTFTDIQQEAPDIAAQLPDTLARGIVFLPIIHRSSSIGLIVAAAPTPRTFTLREVTLLESIAAAIAPALDNARLLQEAQAARKETQKAYEDLRELDDMKTQFIQNVSHELRTPLAIVKGYADLILSDHFDRDNQEVLDQALVAIQAHTNQLTALVEAITTLEDVDTDQMHRTPQPVLPVFLHAIQSIQQPIFRRKITLHTDLPSRLPRINLDAKQLGLAVFHLLDNAVKFNREGGQIWVSAWEEDGHVFCEIKDEGIGIEPAEQDRIFERFYQIDGTTRRKYEGMGLGLSIVKSVIEKHGGRVWVESEGLEKGAKFTFSLPVYSTAKER
jgi:signal transduction histidine kinase